MNATKRTNCADVSAHHLRLRAPHRGSRPGKGRLRHRRRRSADSQAVAETHRSRTLAALFEEFRTTTPENAHIDARAISNLFFDGNPLMRLRDPAGLRADPGVSQPDHGSSRPMPSRRSRPAAPASSRASTASVRAGSGARRSHSTTGRSSTAPISIPTCAKPAIRASRPTTPP